MNIRKSRRHRGGARPVPFAAAAVCRPRRRREDRLADHSGRSDCRRSRGSLRGGPPGQPGGLPGGGRRLRADARVRRAARRRGDTARHCTGPPRSSAINPSSTWSATISISAGSRAAAPSSWSRWRGRKPAPSPPCSRRARACFPITALSAVARWPAGPGCTRSIACWKSPRPPRPSRNWSCRGSAPVTTFACSACTCCTPAVMELLAKKSSSRNRPATASRSCFRRPWQKLSPARAVLGRGIGRHALQHRA